MQTQVFRGPNFYSYEQAIRLSTRFLDNIIDMNKYPVEEIKVATKETRRIGLGIMGIADLLFLLHIPYNSRGGYEFMNKLAEAVSYLSMDESVALAKSRGPFPLFKDTDYVKGRIPVAGYYEIPKETHTYDWSTLVEKIKKTGIRNSWTSTIAPTGTLSMIADTANGVEPVFALVYEKRVTVGRFFYTDKVFENMLKENGLYSDEILTKIANNYGSVRGLPEIPEWMQRIFVTAIDIHWTDHVMAQGVWQKWISNAIAKTINMPGDVTAEDVKSAYLLSHELGLKGVIVNSGAIIEQIRAGGAELGILVMRKNRLHHHSNQDHVLYLLRGEATAKVETAAGQVETRTVRPGDILSLPRGRKHGFEKAGDEDLVFLIVAWVSYAWFAAYRGRRVTSLHSRMDFYRREWFVRMIERDNRMVDVNIMRNLTRSSQFFASTTMLVLGATLRALGWRWTMVVGILGHAARFAVYALFPASAAMIIGVLKLSVIFIILFVAIKWQLAHIFGLVGGLSLCFLAILWEGAAVMKYTLRNGGQ